ncbi:MAG: hypothetical protein JWR05_430 [Mucilaginibacter sp.]|nr:hypothetical protein [Mucilaginibacter sp.]
MNLKEGLRIYSHIDNVSEQFFINSGTTPATEKTGLYYNPGSYVPINDWRKLTQEETNLLFRKKSEQNFSRGIGIGTIPENLKKSLISLRLDECVMPDDVYPKVREQEELVKSITKELEMFFNLFSSTRYFKFHRITRAMPNRETITCHYIDEKFIYIGLHIDQSKVFTIHTAYKSGNRISINLSRETRSLAFINLSVIQIYNMIKKKADLNNVMVVPDNIGHLFFKHYPEYPAVKMDLKPYQYYIAPTDNFLHDATTLGNENIDITIVYTGVFDRLTTVN